MSFFIFLHRYLGLGVGLMILVWFISGFIMLFVQWPSWSYQNRVESMPAVSVTNCCTLPSLDEFSDIELDRFYIEQHPRGPVLFLNGSGALYPISLAEGEYLWEHTELNARALAEQYRIYNGLDGSTATVEELFSDQWTVTADFEPLRSLYKVSLGDTDGTQLYVSSVTGEIVQKTTRAERFWNWPGAITHWLYFSAIRKDTASWAQIVIWLTVVCLFLVGFGLFIGLQRWFSGGTTGSPYRGRYWWHHMSGLAFGLLLLTWLVSGLLSMNPWGLLESRSFTQEVRNLRAMDFRFDQHVRDAIADIAVHQFPEGTKRIEGNLFLGELQVIARDREGIGTVLSRTQLIQPADLQASSVAERMRPAIGVVDSSILPTGDVYYFEHHNPRLLPVRRIIYADGERYYLDPISGELLAAYDQNGKAMRWLFSALHRMDFSALLRERPVWYLFTGLLLLMGLSVAATGVYQAWRRVLIWFGARG